MKAGRLTTVLTCAASVLVAGRLYPTQEHPSAELRALHRSSGTLVEGIILSNPSQGLELNGLKISDVRAEGEDSGFVSRVLMVSPAGAPIMITWISEPRTGRVVTRVTDETTGWWAELWLSTGVEAADAAEALAIELSRGSLSDRAGGVDPEPGLRPVELRTSGHVVLAATVNIASPDLGFGEFLTAARRAREWAALAREVPKHFVDALVVLEGVSASVRAFSSPGGTNGEPLSFASSPGSVGGVAVASLWSDVVTALTASLRDTGILEGTRGTEEWVVQTKPGTIHRYVGVEDPDDLELTMRFRSIDPVDPLPEREIIGLLRAVREGPEARESH